MLEFRCPRIIAITAILISTFCGSSYAQRKGKCTDQPVRFWIYSSATLPDNVTTVPSSILGDGNWYDGQIHLCSGTYDATLNLLSGKRKLTFDFPSPIPGSHADSAIPAGSYQRNAFINVRNLLCSGCTDPNAPFTTHVATQIALFSKQSDVFLRYMPLVVDAPNHHIDPGQLPEENTPYSSSPALVTPQPYNCHIGGTVKPAWEVRGTVPSGDPAIPPGYELQVGTAHRVISNTKVRAGQYSMPFELRIEAQQCFSY